MSNLEPPHPGQVIRRACLETLDLSVTGAARALAVTRQVLNSLVNGEVGISSEMATQLDKVFGDEVETWRQHPLAYDLARARKCASLIEVRPIREQPVRDPESRLF